MNDREIDRAIEAWKVSVQVQQHFNDIEMKIRNYALTLLLAVLASAGVAFREDEWEVAIVVLAAGVLVWLLFWLMDELWYHRLLIGAVTNALEIESQLRDDVPGIDLSTRIKDASAIVLGKRKREFRSKHKIRLFYWGVAFLLIVLMIAICLSS